MANTTEPQKTDVQDVEHHTPAPKSDSHRDEVENEQLPPSSERVETKFQESPKDVIGYGRVGLVVMAIANAFALSFLVLANPVDTYLAVAIPAGFLSLCFLLLVYQLWLAFSWRMALVKDQGIALVPERWAWYLERVSKTHLLGLDGVTAQLSRFSEAITTNSGKIGDLSQSLGIFRDAIESRDKEIERLRSGYDFALLKHYLAKLARFHQLASELHDENPEDPNFRLVVRSVESMLEDAGVEVVEPEIGGDVRNIGAIIDDKMVSVETVDPDNAHKIHRVLTPAYVYEPGGVGAVLRPAKVEVFRLLKQEDLS